MNLKNIAQHIRKQPEQYYWFGPYWWSVKKILRDQGVYDFGPNDEPQTRQQIEGTTGTDPQVIMDLAMEHYQSRIGTFKHGYCQMPNGQEYYLSDPDVLEAAVL